MRQLLILLAALPTVALAADADGGRDGPSGSSGPSPPVAAQDLSAAPKTAVQGADEPECRIGCAQTYYFCKAGDEDQDCAMTWSRCVAACASPDLTPNISTAP